MLEVNDTDFYLVRSTSELIFIMICANFFHSPCKRRFKGRRIICYSLDSVGIEIKVKGIYSRLDKLECSTIRNVP